MILILATNAIHHRTLLQQIASESSVALTLCVCGVHQSFFLKVGCMILCSTVWIGWLGSAVVVVLGEAALQSGNQVHRNNIRARTLVRCLRSFRVGTTKAWNEQTVDAPQLTANSTVVGPKLENFFESLSEQTCGGILITSKEKSGVLVDPNAQYFQSF